MRSVAALMLSIGLSTGAWAAPLVEALYVEGVVPDGAENIDGYIAPMQLPFPNPSIDGDVVRALGTRVIHALPNGNFVGVVNTNPQVDGFGNFPGPNSTGAGAEYLFGSDDRGRTPTAFYRESTINNASTGFVDQEQRDFEAGGGIDNNGNISYSADVPDPRPGRSQFQIDGLWENEDLVYLEGDVIPSGSFAGEFFRSASSVYRSPSGETRWLASIADESFDDTGIATALFRDTTTFDVIIQSGDVIPGLGAIEIGGLTNLGWSIGGGHFIAEVDIEPGFTSTDESITVSGAALMTASGGLVREGQLIPAADGGLPGEVWTGFQHTDVNEAGVAVFGGFTDAPSGMDDVIVVDGEILFREGDVVDGVTLTGLPQGVAINDLGDVAFAWANHLFINGQVIAGLGTAVDRDRDGVTDSTIGSGVFPGGRLEITNLPAAGGDGLPVTYFVGDVAFMESGTTIQADAYFRLAPAPELAGDFNGDGVVDAADYTVWRDTLGSEILLAADGDGDNIVDFDDYTIWAGNFGETLPSQGASVPEPTGVMILAGLLALAAPYRR